MGTDFIPEFQVIQLEFNFCRENESKNSLAIVISHLSKRCANIFSSFSQTFSITCLDTEDKCLRGLCECDKAAALELGRQSREKGCRYQNPGCDKSKPIP